MKLDSTFETGTTVTNFRPDPNSFPYSVLTLCLLLAVLPFEEGTLSLWYGAQLLAALAGMLHLIRGELRQPEPFRMLRNPITAAVWQFALLCAAMAAIAYGRGGEFQLRTWFLYFMAEFATILLLGLMLWNGRLRALGREAPRHRLLNAVEHLVAAWFVLTLLSAAASRYPAISFEALRKETGPYVILFFVTLELTRNFRGLNAMIRTVGILGVIVSGVTIGFWFYYRAQIENPAAYGTLDWMRRQLLIYHNPPYNPDYPWRSVWPAQHPNRLAAYALIAAFAALLTTATMRKRELIVIWSLLALLPAYALFLSQTRGAQLALVLGLALFYLLWLATLLRRAALKWLPPALLLPLLLAGAGWLALPHSTRERFLALTEKGFWRGEWGTFGLRQHAWRAALLFAKEQPLFGIGHGWERFEQEYRELKAAQPEWTDFESKPHAHMNLLENLAENGYPAAALWILLHLLFCAALARAYWRAPAQGRVKLFLALLIALQVALMIYGVTNFALRYRNGLLNWITFAWTLLFLRFIAAAPNFRVVEAVDNKE